MIIYLIFTAVRFPNNYFVFFAARFPLYALRNYRRFTLNRFPLSASRFTI